MASDIKSILIHLSMDEYQCLCKIKNELNLSWKKLLMFLPDNTKKEK